MVVVVAVVEDRAGIEIMTMITMVLAGEDLIEDTTIETTMMMTVT